MHRVYCPVLTTSEVTVDESEAHHLLHVLRCRPGDIVRLFDGCGSEVDACIRATTRRDVILTVTRRESVPRPQHPILTVAVSPPKGDRLKWLVEKLTELGVDRLALLQTERTVVVPGETKVDKLKSNVIAACKQCRRSFLMELQPLQSLSDVVATASTEGQSLWIAHPGIDSPGLSQVQGTRLAPRHTLLVGPEGGFTDDEVALAKGAGAREIVWPDTVLRIETAALAFAVMLRLHTNPQ
jgi:16S rRNA (uracil1498-N3)-methyltransferase